MNFVFYCPETGKTFETDRFDIFEDRGVLMDEKGQKTWDAKVRLQHPCPFCRMIHVYRAAELACPF